MQLVHDSLEVYFSAVLYGTKDVFLYELFFYDLLSPHKDIFAPRARATVERALCRPIDYSSCECCRLQEDEGDDQTMKSTHPPTSVIF
jgi:origin recognition complex subunit 3